ncbi:Lrp/AsnC family transcriptional regulator [Candidatus Woesearchaeota archaeon]|nr:Lrp/AsnC family transcriptional regulator [Candidatus Woesearchaeota archaeon]
MPHNLDLKDKRIINELWANCRQSDSAIAKKVGLSREVVSYRIKRLESSGLIKDYITLVDTAALGYITYQVYLRLKDFNRETESRILKIIKNNPYIKWLTNLSGQWDIFFVMISRSRVEFDSHLNTLIEAFQDNVAERLVLNGVEIYKGVELALDRLEEDQRHHHDETIELHPEMSRAKINTTDYEILRIISRDARMNVVNISKLLKKNKISLTPEAVTYRMKKLFEQKIIRGYRAVIEHNKLNLLWYMLLLNLKTVPTDFAKKFKQFLRMNKTILFADKTLGSWNFRLELLVKDHDAFQDQLIAIRNICSEHLNQYELLMVFNDHTMVSFTEGIYLDYIKKRKN